MLKASLQRQSVYSTIVRYNNEESHMFRLTVHAAYGGNVIGMLVSELYNMILQS